MNFAPFDLAELLNDVLPSFSDGKSSKLHRWMDRILGRMTPMERAEFLSFIDDKRALRIGAVLSDRAVPLESLRET